MYANRELKPLAENPPAYSSRIQLKRPITYIYLLSCHPVRFIINHNGTRLIVLNMLNEECVWNLPQSDHAVDPESWNITMIMMILQR